MRMTYGRSIDASSVLSDTRHLLPVLRWAAARGDKIDFDGTRGFVAVATHLFTEWDHAKFCSTLDLVTDGTGEITVRVWETE